MCWPGSIVGCSLLTFASSSLVGDHRSARRAVGTCPVDDVVLQPVSGSGRHVALGIGIRIGERRGRDDLSGDHESSRSHEREGAALGDTHEIKPYNSDVARPRRPALWRHEDHRCGASSRYSGTGQERTRARSGRYPPRPANGRGHSRAGTGLRPRPPPSEPPVRRSSGVSRPCRTAVSSSSTSSARRSARCAPRDRGSGPRHASVWPGV